MITKRYLLLLFLLIVLGGVAYSLLSHNGHNFTEQQCQDCHAITPIKGKRETLKMKAPIQELCLRCHNSYLENSQTHPVEMAPRSAFPPADLPLSWDGKMTCSTCHDIHASSQGSLLQGRGSLRRNVAGAELCSACHSAFANIDGNKNTKGHGPMMPVVHMNPMNMKYMPDTDVKGGRIDKISQMCLSCHDGSIGANADSRISSGSWKHGGSFSNVDPQGNHPIGVKYRAAARRGGLRPIGALDRRIKLFEGRVGCSSCHDPYSQEPYYLAISNIGSRLCLQCHDK